jgi:hypothetical protein
VLFDKKYLESALVGSIGKGSRMGPGKSAKESVAGEYRLSKMGPALWWADTGSSQDAQAMLRLRSGVLTLGSGMLRLYSRYAQATQALLIQAQVKAAAAYVQRLKRNQGKNNLILSL